MKLAHSCLHPSVQVCVIAELAQRIFEVVREVGGTRGCDVGAMARCSESVPGGLEQKNHDGFSQAGIKAQRLRSRPSVSG